MGEGGEEEPRSCVTLTVAAGPGAVVNSSPDSSPQGQNNYARSARIGSHVKKLRAVRRQLLGGTWVLAGADGQITQCVPIATRKQQ